MPVTRNLADAIIRQQRQALSLKGLGSQQRGRIVLGGTSGSAGGSGGPPGGFVGKLVQSQICYDTTEAESLSGSTSLVDNLNHIRYDISQAGPIAVVDSSGSNTIGYRQTIGFQTSGSTSVVIIPTGTSGSIQHVLQGSGVVVTSGSNYDPIDPFYIKNPDTWDLYDDGGTNTLTMTVASGAATVQRTAGSYTYDGILAATWI